MSDCLSHLHEKHGDSQYVAMNNLGKFFPPWTVPRDVWQMALRPDVSGEAVDVRRFMSPDAGWYTNTGLQGPIPSSGTPGASDEQVGSGGPSHGAIDAPPHLDTSFGIGRRSSAGGMFPDCAASTSVDGSPPGFFRQ